MEGLYSPASFSLGVIIGFFLTLSFTGEGLGDELLRKKENRAAIANFYYWSGRLTIFLCVVIGAYIFYKEYTIFVGYFAALLAGAIIGQLYIVILSILGFLGRVIIYLTGGLSAFVTTYVVWLYYSGTFLQKIGNIDLLRYLPGT